VFRELFKNSKPTGTVTNQTKPAPTTKNPSESILGIDTQLEGTLRSGGHVRLEGTFTGDVSARGRVIIGEEAKLEGDLIGETVTVGGVIRGDITARRIAITRTGRVWGDLRQEILMTEEGGFIQGIVTMEEKLDIGQVIEAKEGLAGEIVEEALEEARDDAGKKEVFNRKTR
jgi:cytoskeletal protein CcmA (bactofilin family)